MAKDISKKTVLVILLIAIVVSVVGTWTVLDAASSVTIPKGPQTSHANGKIQLTVGTPTQELPQVTGGMVALTKL